MQVTPTKGKIARVRVRTESADGIDVSRIRVHENGWVSFYFRESTFKKYIPNKETSDAFYVTYDLLETGDILTLNYTAASPFGNGNSGVTRVVLVPEPVTAVLVGLGLAGVALARRRSA